jgi:hypothetical protein
MECHKDLGEEIFGEGQRLPPHHLQGGHLESRRRQDTAQGATVVGFGEDFLGLCFSRVRGLQ